MILNKRIFATISLIIISINIIFGQNPISDSSFLELNQVIITATRTALESNNIPMRGSVLIPNQTNTFKNANIDGMLYQIPNAYIDRRSGIFSKNSSVSLRGLNGSTRTLVLSNGIPINKTDGGGVNWNRINPETIEKIEVIKGPGSSLYGFNAMGGVVNMITKKPIKKNEFSASTWLGSYNSKGASMYYGTRNKVDTGFYFSIDAFTRLGDGYIAEPDSTKDSTSAKLYVKDYGTRFLCGYNFSRNTYLEAEYSYSYNESGDGMQIFDPKGAYYSYKTNNARIFYTIEKNSFGKINVLAYYQNENYIYQKENFKKDKLPPYKVTAYNLTQTNAIREDFGINLWHSIKLTKNINITYGFEARQGSGIGSEIWFTSTDTMKTKGVIRNFGAYIQHESSFLSNKLKWISSIRYDDVIFFDGSYQIFSPSASNELLQYYNSDYSSKSWQGFSPKTGLIYNFTQFISSYINFSGGFRPPMLDDMINNRSITKGFKLANPILKPETIYSIEAGGTFRYKRSLIFEPSIYYMQGNDFNYFVATGDTIWGDNKPKPVLQRDNIAQVNILGAEAAIRFYFNYGISGYLNYSYNNSIIGKYDKKTENDIDLKGKTLTEVPTQMASIGINWQNKIVNAHFSFNYVGSTFSDDENLIKLDDYYTLNMKLSRTIYKSLDIWFQIQNINDNIYINNKGQKGLGRFISGGLRVAI